MFYTGPGYKTTKENIANWAKFTIPEFKDNSIDIQKYGMQNLLYKK